MTGLHRRHRVAVIGGGLSGLMVADSLPRELFDVVVLEGSDRLGGRVHTRRDLVPGAAVEAGAELIGRNHRMWNQLSARFGLRLDPVPDAVDYERRGLQVRWSIGGRLLDSDEQRHVQEAVEPALRIIGDEARGIDPRRPWTAAGAAELDALTVAERLRIGDLELDPLTLDYLELVLGNDQCRPTRDQSYLGLLSAVSAHRLGTDMMAYWEQTETHRCAGGNDQLVIALADGLAEVRRCAPVTALRIAADGVEVDVAGGSRTEHETYDFAVLATSPQTWPGVTSDDPSDGFRAADYTMNSGPAVKFLSAFVEPFWEQSDLSPSVLSDAIGDVWESVDRRSEQPAIGCGLSVFSGGDYVRTPETLQQDLELLFPGYGAQVRRRELVDWPENPWVRTGYSNPAPGEVTTIAPRLSQPYRGRLFFAGEQASAGFFGYMEGALEAGVVAARRVAVAAGALVQS